MDLHYNSVHSNIRQDEYKNENMDMLNRMPFRKQRESDLSLILTFKPDVLVDERIKKIQTKHSNPLALQNNSFQV